MTEDNKKENIKNEVERADQALQAARALLSLGLYSDAVSRAYYGAFHALRALLYSRGLEAKTHSGAFHLLNQEFIRIKQLPSSLNRVLGGLQRARELADYNATVVFSAEDAEVRDGTSMAIKRKAGPVLTTARLE